MNQVGRRKTAISRHVIDVLVNECVMRYQYYDELMRQVGMKSCALKGLSKELEMRNSKVDVADEPTDTWQRVAFGIAGGIFGE